MRPPIIYVTLAYGAGLWVGLALSVPQPVGLAAAAAALAAGGAPGWPGVTVGAAGGGGVSGGPARGTGGGAGGRGGWGGGGVGGGGVVGGPTSGAGGAARSRGPPGPGDRNDTGGARWMRRRSAAGGASGLTGGRGPGGRGRHLPSAQCAAGGARASAGGPTHGPLRASGCPGPSDRAALRRPRPVRGGADPGAPRRSRSQVAPGIRRCRHRTPVGHLRLTRGDRGVLDPVEIG